MIKRHGGNKAGSVAGTGSVKETPIAGLQTAVETRRNVANRQALWLQIPQHRRRLLSERHERADEPEQEGKAER
jgi:hypothetical protein